MKTTKALFFILVLLVGTRVSMAQQPQTAPLSTDDVSKTVELLSRYFETYESETSDLEKHRKFMEAFTHGTKGTASLEELNQAFSFIDAYIKADKKPEDTTNGQQDVSFDEAFKQTDQYKETQLAVEEIMGVMMNMSYPEFENLVMQVRPDLSKKEIKEAYNQIHQGTDKKVNITAADNEMTTQQQMLWAMETIKNPANFQEFSKAMKILDPKMSDDVILRAWNGVKPK